MFTVIFYCSLLYYIINYYNIYILLFTIILHYIFNYYIIYIILFTITLYYSLLYYIYYIIHHYIILFIIILYYTLLYYIIHYYVILFIIISFIIILRYITLSSTQDTQTYAAGFRCSVLWALLIAFLSLSSSWTNDFKSHCLFDADVGTSTWVSSLAMLAVPWDWLLGSANITFTTMGADLQTMSSGG